MFRHWRVLACQAEQVEGELQDALSSRDALKQEVENTPPMLVVESGSNGVPLDGPAPKTRLQEARRSAEDVVAEGYRTASRRDSPAQAD